LGEDTQKQRRGRKINHTYYVGTREVKNSNLGTITTQSLNAYASYGLDYDLDSRSCKVEKKSSPLYPAHLWGIRCANHTQVCAGSVEGHVGA